MLREYLVQPPCLLVPLFVVALIFSSEESASGQSSGMVQGNLRAGNCDHHAIADGSSARLVAEGGVTQEYGFVYLAVDDPAKVTEGWVFVLRYPPNVILDIDFGLYANSSGAYALLEVPYNDHSLGVHVEAPQGGKPIATAVRDQTAYPAKGGSVLLLDLVNGSVSSINRPQTKKQMQLRDPAEPKTYCRDIIRQLREDELVTKTIVPTRWSGAEFGKKIIQQCEDVDPFSALDFTLD